MRILHLSSEFPPQSVYGLGRYVNELASAQAALGHHVNVITNSLGGDKFNSSVAGVHIKRVHFPPPPKAPSTSSMLLHFNLQILERALESRDTVYDVVNAHDWLTVPAGFHCARLLGAPLVTTLHDVVFNKVRGREFSAEDAYIAGIENWALHASAKTILLSQSVRDEAIAHYHVRPERTNIIPGGVGITPLNSSDLDSIGAWRSKLAPNDEDLILYVGRLDPEKGLLTLFKALVNLRNDASVADRWKLALAGTGTLREQLDEFSRKNSLASHIAFLDYLPFEELRIAYGSADIVVVPSDYEPFGLVALEAQRMGTPVVVSKTGGLVETLERTLGGTSFTAGRSEELSEALRKLILDSEVRTQLGRRGQENVSRLYSWNSLATEVTKLYGSLTQYGPPENIIPPEWAPPNSRTAITNLQRSTPLSPIPISDLTVFWDAAFMPHLSKLLEPIVSAHALNALNGKINVVPVSGKDSDLQKPQDVIQNSRVRYINLNSDQMLKQAIRNSAALFVDARLAGPLLKSNVVVPSLIPTFWIGPKTDPSIGGWAVHDIADLYTLATKALCDNRFRREVAGKLFNPIPQFERKKSSQRTTPLIVHVVPQIVTGGAETVLLDLIKATTPSFSHEILCLGPLEGPLPGEFGDARAPIMQVSLDVEDNAIDWLRDKDPDVLHLHSMSYVPNWICIHRRLWELPIIETEHVVNIGSGHFGRVDIVACVSEATRKAHDQHRPAWRRASPNFEVVYNGIDLDAFAQRLSRSEARRRLNLPDSRPIIGRVSALARNKLPQEALEVIPHILREIPNALFVIVGDGPQRGPAEAWVAEKNLSDSVQFLGERRDVPQVLPAFDVFAYYTTKDALGNVILEAIAAGIPVVTTDVEGTREALGDAPGELVKLGAFEEFAAAAGRWADPDRVQKPHKLPAKFTRRAMAEAYSSLYTSLKSLGKSTASATRIAPKKGAPEVSILMPVFNTPKEWVLDALASIKAQHYPLWKLKLVDDGSDTEYHQWLGQTIKSDRGLAERTKILRLASNKGVAAALNAGLHACKTELVARMDADDRMHPDRLALQVAAFNDRPQLTVLGGWACLIDEKGRPTNGRYSYPCGHRQLIQMLGKSCAFAHPTVMYRREAILAAGGYSAKCRHYEDYDLWVRLAKRRAQFANLPAPLIDYRVHDKSVSQIHQEQQSRGAADCAERARKLVPASGRGRPARVIFTGVHHSYGIPGRGLSVEQFFFARAMEHMPEIELHRLSADDLIRKHGQKKAGEMLRAFALEKRADLVFTVLGNPELDFLRDDIKALTDSGILTLNWNCDDQWRFPYTSEFALLYSHMVTTDPLAMKRFEQLGLKKKIILSQWGCNPFDYSPGVVKDIDVSFIGQPYGNRPAMIDALRNAGIHVVLHGAGWNDGQEIEFAQMIDVLRRSRVVLNFSRATQGDHRQIKARFFEIPACGSFMLTEPADGMDAYLTPGRHFDTFDSPDELVSKARLWLKRPERDAWALEASAIIRSVHSYAWRLHAVFEAIGLFNRP